MIFTDTNIILRSMNPADRHYAIADGAMAKLRLRKQDLCIAPQTLVEFWAVATRSRDDNGLGLDITRAAKEIAALRRLFHVLTYTSEVMKVWGHLVTSLGICGKQTHDAHIAAIMQVDSVSSILSFNYRHFKRFPGITVLNPEDV